MLRSVVRIRDVAAAWSKASKTRVTVRCARRRLLAYDRKIGGGLLVQFMPRGAYFDDAEMLARYMPGIVHGDAEDPALALLRRIAETGERMDEKLDEVLVRVSVPAA